MIKEAIGVGETLEEATERAKAELNASFEDEVQFEVLTYPKKKALGLFGGSPAKVRVFIEVPDPKPTKKAKPDRKKERPAKKEKPVAKVEKNEVKETEAEPEVPMVPADQIDAASPAGRAVAYLKNILANLGVGETEITVALLDKGAKIAVSGDDLGIIIGRRGETLDALQYLCSLAANSGDGFFRVSLDTGNYRQKREQTLKSLARRMSSQVLRTGRSRTLEPMNPYERRIIHTEVQAIDGVESASVGEGMGRRVVISPVGAPPRRDDRRGRGRNGGRKPAAAPTATPDREPKKDMSLPLYGKID